MGKKRKSGGRQRRVSQRTIDFLQTLEPGHELQGTVTNRVEYGLFVSLGEATGLCHRSELGKHSLEQFEIGYSVRVRILRVQVDEGKVSLSLVAIGAKKEAQPRKEKRRPRKSGVIGGAVQGDQTAYAASVSAAIDGGADAINRTGAQFANNTSASRAGFVAEADHTATFNVDSAFKRSDLRAERPAANTKNSPDINVVDGKGRTVAEASAKVYKTAKRSAKAQRGYGEQDRLVPKDQLKQAKAHAKGRAASERAKGRPNRDRVAKEWDEVAEKATDRVEHDGVKSRARTRSESKKTAERARAGKVKGSDITGEMAERAMQGAKSGAQSGAVAGAAITGVVETVVAVKAVYKGDKSVGDAAKDAAVGVAKGTADGALKGAAGGAASAAAQVAARKVASGAAKSILKGGGPAAVAITGVEVAKHAALLAAGKMDKEQFKAAAGDSVKGGAASYVGSSIGAAIGGPPGAIIGGIVGPVIASQAEKQGVVARMERALSSNTAVCLSGSDAFHLEQKGSMERSMRVSDAAVFLNRVVPDERRGHLSASAVVLHGRTVYAIDFKAWRGELGFAPVVKERRIKRSALFGLIKYEDTERYETGELDERELVKVAESSSGNLHEKVHRNPVRRLRGFARSLKIWLGEQDRRWRDVWIETLVVFPTGKVELSPELRAHESFVTTEDLEEILSKGSQKPPRWMVDALSMTPTWDMLQNPKGDIYQGLIKNTVLPLKLSDGVLELPFTSILKAEVERGGTLSRADRVRVTLRSGQVVDGSVEKLTLTINRMGYEESFLLRDLQKIVPASTLFTLDLQKGR